MSNRTSEEINALAALKVSHLQQIEALLQPGLTPVSRVKLFAQAVGFDEAHTAYAIGNVVEYVCGEVYSPVRSVWEYGQYPKSLFADLPGCSCPVVHLQRKGVSLHPDIPQHISANWSPTRKVLEAFAQVQQKYQVVEL